MRVKVASVTLAPTLGGYNSTFLLSSLVLNWGRQNKYSKVIGSGKASANGSLPRADRPVEAQKEESGGGTGGDMLAKDFLQLSTAVSCYLIVFVFIFCIGSCSVLDPDPLV